MAASDNSPGLLEDVLDGKDQNYSIALSCFFITYIVLSIPGTLAAKHFLPSRTIACGSAIWAIAATCQAATQNPAGLYVCRLFVGVGESLFGQAMALHLSYWYTKRDLARRIGFFISAGAVSGAFGGLISFGVTSIKHAKIANWRILFLIEGCPSVLLAICVALFMPTRPETSRFLTEDERTLCLTRLNAQNSTDAKLGIQKAGVIRCLTDWKTYVVSIMYSCMNLTLGSVGGFLPTIISECGSNARADGAENFGYTNARAQLMTVPPYAVALVFMLLLTTFSDRRQTPGIPVMVPFALGIIGWAVLLSVPPTHGTQAMWSGRYFACCCIVTAGYTNIPLIMAWQSANTGNESQRATSLGMLNTIGQCLSVLAAFLFPKPESPKFTKGCIVNLAFQCLGLVIALGMTSWYRYENRVRDRAEGGRPAPGTPLETLEYHDLAVGFRYTP